MLFNTFIVINIQFIFLASSSCDRVECENVSKGYVVKLNTIL